MDPGSLLMLAVVMVIFYFVLVRPQKKRLKEHNALVSSLAPGDEVLTIGGIYGFVNRVGDDDIWLEVAEDTEMRVTRQSVSRRVSSGGGTQGDEPEELGTTAESAEPDGTVSPGPGGSTDGV